MIDDGEYDSNNEEMNEVKKKYNYVDKFILVKELRFIIFSYIN